MVDNSYSLAAEAMIERVKGLAYALLHDAANHGDRLAVVAFGGFAEATVALPFTRSAQRAPRAARAAPRQWSHAAADALVRAHRLLRQERAKHPNMVPYIVASLTAAAPCRSGPGATPPRTRSTRRGASRATASACSSPTPPPGSPEALANRAPGLAAAARGECVPFQELAA